MNGKNTMSQWKIINELVGCKHLNDQIILKGIDNVVIQDQVQVANTFNNFFLAIADEFRNSIQLEINYINTVLQTIEATGFLR